MTSTQTMLRGLGAFLITIVMVGCTTTRPDLIAPDIHIAPYDTRGGEVLWAMVPLLNETGTTSVDALAVSDAVAGTAQQIRGVQCLPVNRTIEAMRKLGITGVATEGEARALAQAMGVQGILVGTITAWDPYDPPTIGLTLAYFPARVNSVGEVDPKQLTRASTDQAGSTSVARGRPAIVVSEHLDARSHEVQVRLKEFAEGRSDEQSAFGWRVYLASMDLYTNFAAYELIGTLLDEEWIRLARESSRQALGSSP